MHKGEKLGYTDSLIKPNHFWTFPKNLAINQNQSEQVKFGSGVALKGRDIETSMPQSLSKVRPNYVTPFKGCPSWSLMNDRIYSA